VIIMALPLLHLFKPSSIMRRLLYAGIVCAMCYRCADSLTVKLCSDLRVLVAWRSKHRAAYLAAGLPWLHRPALMTGCSANATTRFFSQRQRWRNSRERLTSLLEDFKISLAARFWTWTRNVE
jgi:hypothetical protein